MSRITTNALKIFQSTSCYAVLVIVSSGSVVALDHHDDYCARATSIHLGTTVRYFADATAEVQCFETYVPSAGMLMLDVSVPAAAQVEPGIEFYGQLCDAPEDSPAPFIYVERWATNMLLAIRTPGSYLFCVGAQDPELVLGEYRLTSGFSVVPVTKGGDPEEDEPDPDPAPAPAPAPVVVVGSSSPFVLHDVCRRNVADDHGDTFRCATPLGLGEEVSAEIRSDWGDDDDLFTFVLEELRTVRIETTGSTDTFGSLYDRDGNRLRTDDDGGSDTNFRIVKTLSPGAYSVRVTGGEGMEGSYQLTVEVLDR